MTGPSERDAFLAALRAAAEPVALRVRGGLECPGEEELASFAEGGLDEPSSERVRGHLGDCGHCLLLLEAALEEIRDQGSAGVLRGPGSERRSGLRGLVPWLVAAAGVAFLMMILPPGAGPANPLAELAQVESLSWRTTRGAGDPESFEGRLAAGRAAYLDGRYEESRLELERASALRPDDPLAALYLGSACLLVGEVGAALPHLRRSVDVASDDSVRESARWTLVQALLLEGDGDGALVQLDAIVELGARKADSAEDLAERVRATR